MMQQLGWRTLEERRTQARAFMMYTVQGSSWSSCDTSISLSHSRARRAREDIAADAAFQLDLLMPSAFRHSFFPATIRMWNNLPSAVIMSPSTEAFKS